MSTTTLQPYAADIPHVEGVTNRDVVVDGVRLHVAEAGPSDGDPVVLLHGWPQNWFHWRHLFAPLAGAGYRVIAPDTRAMGWSEAPETPCSVRTLSDELLRLLDVLGLDRGVRLVGHDWGLITGTLACLEAPERFERFVPMSGVHIWSATGSNPIIYARPWHIYMLGSPVGARLVEHTRFPALLMRYWRGNGDPEHVDLFLDKVQRPASARATNDWYGDLIRHKVWWFVRHHRSMRLRVPTLHLNGALDPLTIGTPESYRRFTDDMRMEFVPGAGHFLAEERPDDIATRLIEFFR